MRHINKIQFSFISIIEINKYSRWLNAISVDIPTESSKNNLKIRLKIKIKIKIKKNSPKQNYFKIVPYFESKAMQLPFVRLVEPVARVSFF